MAVRPRRPHRDGPPALSGTLRARAAAAARAWRAAGAPRERLVVRPERLALRRDEGPPAPLRVEAARGTERTTIAPAGDGDWRAIEVDGVLDLALTGVLARLSAVLAAAEVPLFAVSTYDTDVLLVRAEHLARAVAAFRAAGHEVAA